MDQIWSNLVFGQRKSKLVALHKLASNKENPFVEIKEVNKTPASVSRNQTISKLSTEPFYSKTKSRNERQNDSKKTQVTGIMSVKENEAKASDSNSIIEKTSVSKLVGSYNPRCVMFHPSMIPPISKLRSLVVPSSEMSVLDVKPDPCRWFMGDMFWGKIRGYPFWPCMVTRDPFMEQFTKTEGSLRSYHVQFFGARAERSWISEASLMEFEGRQKYLDIVKYRVKKPSRSFKAPDECKISAAWYPAWSLAVAEAEGAFKLARDERVTRYTFQYMIVKGGNRKPVDDLVKVVKHRKDCHSGSDDEKKNNDDESLYSKIFHADHGRSSIDSDDDYISDNSSVSEARSSKCPVRIKLRIGLLEVFIAKHSRFVQAEHPDWDTSDVAEHLQQQWSVMSHIQRSRYTSRHQKAIFMEVKKCKRKISDDDDDDEDEEMVDPNKLDLQIFKLSEKCLLAEYDQLCHVCEGQGSNLVFCDCQCGRSFHASCIEKDESGDFICEDCSSGTVRNFIFEDC